MLELSNWIQNLTKRMGYTSESVEDAKVQEIAQIIGTYRDVDVEDESVTPEATHWVNTKYFDFAMGVLVVLNTIVIALETDLGDPGGDPEDREVRWIILEAVLCLFFISEVVLKVCYNSWRWCKEDFWNKMTTVVTLLLFVDLAILFPVGHNGILRLISLLRFCILFRFLRSIRFVKELQHVLNGIIGALPSLLWVAVILFLLVFTFAVWTTSLIGQNEDFVDYQRRTNGFEHEEYFGTIGRSMFTLLQIVTLDSWCSSIARYVADRHWYLSIFFIMFIIMTTFSLLNIIVSLIVEQTLTETRRAESRASVRAEKTRRNELEKLREIFMLADADYSGVLDLHEFITASQDPEVLSRLMQLEMPVEEATQLFQVMEGNGSRSLTMKEFIDGCTKLKGQARSKELMGVKAQADTMKKQLDLLGKELQDTERMLSSLEDIANRLCNRFKPSVESSRRKIAQRIGGSAPTVPAYGERGINPSKSYELSTGNRPVLPAFPNLLA